LAQAAVAASVGSASDARESALAETINGLYKTRLIKRQAPWNSRQQLERQLSIGCTGSTTKG